MNALGDAPFVSRQLCAKLALVVSIFMKENAKMFVQQKPIIHGLKVSA